MISARAHRHPRELTHEQKHLLAMVALTADALHSQMHRRTLAAVNRRCRAVHYRANGIGKGNEFPMKQAQ